MKDVKKQKVDRIIFLGDASTLGIRPVETLEMLESLACDCIMGNHDEFMIEPAKIGVYTKNKLVIDTVEWSRARHSKRNIDFIKTFRKELRFELVPGMDILCYHGSPVSNMENVTPDSDMESFVPLFGGKRKTLFIGGHTHVQMLRNFAGMRIITSGSVGQPFIGYTMPPVKHPWAEYVVIQTRGRQYSVDFKQVEIDNDAINREILASDSPMNDFISEY